MTPTDEIQKTKDSSIFHPYQHQDYYGLDSLFLSPLKAGEIWNLQNVPSVSPQILAFLTLRSYLLSELGEIPLQITGLSRVWKSYLGKSAYLSKNPNVKTSEFVPGLVSLEDELDLEGETSHSQDWNHFLRWEHRQKGRKFIFLISAGKKENTSSRNLSELLSQFLVDTQKYDRLTKAYIRKETSSYLYLQSEDQIHPRVFFRDDVTPFPEFLLFIAELIPA